MGRVVIASKRHVLHVDIRKLNLPLEEVFNELLENPLIQRNFRYDDSLMKLARSLVTLKLSIHFIFPVPELFKDLSRKPPNSYKIMQMMKMNSAFFRSMKRDKNELAIYLELVSSIKQMIKEDFVEYVVVNSLNKMKEPEKLLNPYPEVWAPAFKTFLKNADEFIEPGIPILRNFTQVKNP